MPYAVTCKSCGARFSVADDLFRKKLQGKLVTLRCRQCGSAIRINASKPPMAASPPERQPSASTPLAAEVPSAPADLPDDLGDEEAFVALSPGLLSGSGPPMGRSLGGNEAPAAASSNRLVDLLEAARSEPPSAISQPPSALSEAPVSSSNAPKLSDLVQLQAPSNARSSDDVDFLLGLSGSAETNAALTAPALPDLTSAPEPPSAIEPASEPLRVQPASGPAANAERPVHVITPAASAPPSKESGFLKYLLVGAALFGAGFVVIGRSRHAEQETTAPLPGVAASAQAPERQGPTDGVGDAPGADLDAHPLGASNAEGPGRPLRAPRAPGAASDDSPEGAPSAKELEGTPALGGAASADSSLPKPDAAPVGAFDREAAATALTAAASEAAACRKPGQPSGMASVVVTFAPSGRVTSATLNGPPFAGTATGGCIAATLRRARVPAFEGDKVTVAKTVVIQ